MTELIPQLIDIFRHLPDHLQGWAENFGSGIYFILAAIIFAETGLVICPLLPGDSLLFAAGAVLALATSSQLSLPIMCVILILAAFLGDLLNYHVGRWLAPRLFREGRIRGLNPKHLEKTKQFYVKHGGKTLILARFVPIVRTYAPFVAGLTGLPRRRFIAYSLVGGALWITLFLNLGYYFGNIPTVKSNFELVILAIIFLSFLTMVIEFIRSRRLEAKNV
jgi:membrane-associated protein